jgi:hypothetical protein
MGNRATTIFDAEDSKFQAAYKRVDRALLNLQHKFASAGKIIAKALAIPAAATAGLAAGIKHELSIGDELYKLSKQSGVAVADLFTIGKEFKHAGLEADQAAPAIEKMLNSIATHGADDTIAQLGINLEELRSKSPADQFKEIGLALGKLPDAASRVAAARAIFGKSGAELLAVFSEHGFGDAGKEFGQQAATLQRDAALFHRTSIDLEKAGNQMKGFFLGVADRVVPVLQPILEAMKGRSQQGKGEEVGGIIATFIQAFSSGIIGDILFTSIKISFAKAADFFAGALLAVVGAVGGIFLAGFRSAATIFEVLTTGNFWRGMGNALLGIGKSFIAILLDGVAMLLEKLSIIPGLGKKAAEGAKSLRETAENQRRSASGSTDTAFSQITPVAEKAQADFMKAIKSPIEVAGRGFADGLKLFNVDKLQSHLDGLTSIANNLRTEKTQDIQKKFGAEEATGGPGLNFGTHAPLVSALQRIGGAGGAGGTRDPLIDLHRSTNSLLTQIRDRLATTSASAPSASEGASYA